MTRTKVRRLKEEEIGVISVTEALCASVTHSVASSSHRFFFFFLGYSVRKCRPDVSPRGKEHADYSGIREERNFTTRRARGGGGGEGGEKGGRPHERTRGDAIN